MKRFAFLFFMLLLAVWGITQSTPLRLKQGDAVKVVVLGFPNYSGDYYVLSDGSVTGIGFGQVQAAGKTVAQFRADVTKLLTKYILKPQVDIVVRQERLEAVYVVRNDSTVTTNPNSNTLRPQSGGYPYQPNMELRQLIALSGTPVDPQYYETKVYRNGNVFQSIDLPALLGGDPKQWNGPLEPGDLVTILPLPEVRVWVAGEVRAPGEFRLRKSPNALQAIAVAGGTTDTIDQDDLEIVLRRGTDETTYPLNSSAGNLTLEYGDTIYVRSNLIQVTVGGEVTAPGSFKVRRNTTVDAAVQSFAKGPLPTGSLENVLVSRKDEVLVVDASPSESADKRLILQDGDSVFVQVNQKIVTVLGEVNQPGRILLKAGEEIHLADALGRSGGLNQRGTLRRVYVLTPVDGKFTTMQFNLDEYLKDGKVAANPLLKSGDVVMFGTPRGITVDTVTRTLSSLLILDTIIKR